MLSTSTIYHAVTCSTLEEFIEKSDNELAALVKTRSRLTGILKAMPAGTPAPDSISIQERNFADFCLQFSETCDVVALKDFLPPMPMAVVYDSAGQRTYQPTETLAADALPTAVTDAYPIHTYQLGSTNQRALYAKWWTMLDGHRVLVMGPSITRAQVKILAPSYRGVLFHQECSTKLQVRTSS